MIAPCVSARLLRDDRYENPLLETGILTIGGVGVAIPRIVIVQRAVRIAITHIVRIGRVRSTEPVVGGRTHG